MNRMFKFKNIIFTVLVCCIMWSGGSKVNAQTEREAEPNNIKEAANTMQVNRETAAELLEASRSGQFVIDGYISNTDEDWYKVYLLAGIQYVTCNGEYFTFQVFNSEDSLLLEQTYSKEGFGVTAFPFEVFEPGEYYVKITTITTTPTNYKLLVGGPTYDVAGCKVNMDSVSMTGSDELVTVDLRNESRIPERSFIYNMSIKNVGFTSVKSISVKNFTENSTLNFVAPPWNKNSLLSMGLPLKSRWDITFKYKKNEAITPQFVVDFVYPVIGRQLDTLNIIIG